jgi:hypothetical protein
MTGTDPDREPQSETAEKGSIRKTHEEFIGDMAQPSVRKEDYERRKKNERQKSGEEGAPSAPGAPDSKPNK